MNKGISKIREYERMGYRFEIMDVEESQYKDDEAGEAGERVVIQVALKKITYLEAC